MHYRIEYAEGKCCNFANSRKDLIVWLKLLKEETISDIRKRYWERQAEKRNIRASWQDYGITKERYRELQNIVRSDECTKVVLNSAIKADEMAAGHIILSVVKELSYENIEFDEKLGRCPIGRTDFYGVRRLFFHYLDCALKAVNEGVSACT